MKREGNLYQKICSLENLRQAELNARSGKEHQYGVKVFDRNADENLLELRDHLLYKEYSTSPYDVFTVNDGKERTVCRLPYYPDRIVHHAIMLQIEQLLNATLTADTYSCLRGRGVHAAKRAVERAFRNVPATQYCLQMDVRKYYESVDHDILKGQLSKKIKDPDLTWLLHEIIDSAVGLPIGNYISQAFANFYLSPFDHWLKETQGVRHYFRYMDDIVILGPDKQKLWELRVKIIEYLNTRLKLQVKPNHRIFPVREGIDFTGYKMYPGYTLMRKRIKQAFARAAAKRKSRSTICGYLGWAKQCNSNHLIKKLLHEPV